MSLVLKRITTKRSTGKGQNQNTTRARTFELLGTNECQSLEGINISSNLLMISHVYLLHHKSNSLEKFREYKSEVENQLGKTIKTLCSDRGGDYVDLRF